MPKRKSNPCALKVPANPSLTCLDAALDILACDTFTSLQRIVRKFESAAGIELNEGVAKQRWEEACKRYWVTKAMEDLCCGKLVKTKDQDQEEKMDMEDDKGKGRALPDNPHPGAAVAFKLNVEEEREWRKWQPRLGDIVLVELAQGGAWPGKIIDKKTVFQGRTVPRGNHFFCIRTYSAGVEASVTIKSRMIPLDLRPDPPLLASEELLSAYNHANNPGSFDEEASAREAEAAYRRTHPGVSNGDEPDRSAIKEEREKWNGVVNWVMNERRIEKMRQVNEEREKKLQSVAKTEDWIEGRGEAESAPDGADCPKKRRTAVTVMEKVSNGSERGGIFKVVRQESECGIGNGNGNGNSIFGRLTPPRHHSPRRFDKRRTFTGLGEFSPKGRGTTYTPPRILPSGDETAPHSPSPAPPSLQTFDFVSPLGPVKLSKLSTLNVNGHNSRTESYTSIGRSGSLSGMSLEAVKEEPLEDEPASLSQGEWTLVTRAKRAGSLPCRDKGEMGVGALNSTAFMEVEG